MKNTRTTQGRIKRALKLTAGITMLALLFVIVFAGTLSGAFGVEENLVQNGTIQENVADAMSQNSFSTYNLTYNDFTLIKPSKSKATKNTPNDGGVILMKGDNSNRGAFYAEVELKGDLLNHVKNGATVTVSFSTYQNNKIGDDADKYGVAITSSTPYYDSSNDDWGGGHNFLANSAMNDDTGSGKRKTAQWKITSSTTKFYVAIFVRADWGLRAEFFDIKIEFTYSYDYSVSFSSADTAKGTVYPATSHITASTDVSETKATSTATPNAGYHFVNWTQGSTTTEHTTNATISIGSTDYFSYKSYTANFAANELKARYYNNTNPSDKTYDDQTITYNSSGEYSLKTLPKSEDGRTFVGWAIKADGNVYYKYGEKAKNNLIYQTDISLASNHGAIVEFYAVWVASDFGVLAGGDKNNGTWGSASNPFAIETAQHLKNLSDIVNNVRQPVDSVTGTYYGNAISTSATDIQYTNCYFVVTADIYVNLLASFARIANDSSHYFNGNFNGQSHVIYNLSCGLFGYVDGGTFQNLTVRGSVSNVSSDNYGGLIGYATNITVSGVVNEVVLTSSKTNIGGVVGFCQNATIENCHNKANVSGIANVGGIVGFTGDTEKVGFGSHINNSTNSGNIVVSGDFAGGIVGWGRDTNYTRCYNTNSISAGGNNVGGITGRVLGGSVVDSHNQATIQGNNYVGGIAGNLSWATITDVSNSGEISGNDYVGGLLGFGECNDKTNLLIKGVLSNTGRVGGNTYVGGIVGSLNNNNAKQPENKCEIEWTATVQATGGDTIKGVCYVGGAIGYLSQRINISGTIDVNVSEIDREDGGNYCIGGIIGYNAGTISATMTSAGRIIARSSGTVGDKTGAFAGGIVGYNAASGVISSSASRVASSGGRVGDVLDVGDGGYVGGICGYNAGKIGSNKSETIATYTYIESVSSDQNFKVVDGGDNVGGFIGCNEGEIFEHTIIDVNVTVNGNDNVGGLFGYTKDITLSNITHTTSVNGAGSVGGFVGYLEGKAIIAQCVNNGTITATGTSGIGGFVGSMKAGSTLDATNCTNNASVSNPNANGAGGIVGYMQSGDSILSVIGCKNTGAIVGARNAGGIGGRLETTRDGTGADEYPISVLLSNCYNSGQITADKNGTVGGIAGYLFGNKNTSNIVALLTYCYSNGAIKSSTTDANPNIGGIVGNPAVPKGGNTVAATVSYSYTTFSNISGRVAALVESLNTLNGRVENNCYVITTSSDANFQVANGGSYIRYTWGALSPVVTDGTNYEIFAWEDILSNNINGFKVSGQSQSGKYVSSYSNIDTMACYTKVESTAVNNSAGNSKITDTVFDVTYCIGASFALDIVVELQDIVQKITDKIFNNDNQEIDVELNKNITPYLACTYYFIQGGLDQALLFGKDCYTYDLVTEIYASNSNRVVVGRISGSQWTINKRELSVSKLTWNDGQYNDTVTKDRSSLSFIYNTKGQGISGLEFDGIPNGVQAPNLFSVTSTNSAPVSIPHIVKNVGNYTVTYTIQDTHNYEFEDGSTSVTFKWTIAKNQLTLRNAWTSDIVLNDGENYGFIFNNSPQGTKDRIKVVAQKDTLENRHVVPDDADIYRIAYLFEGDARNVGEYSATFTLLDTSNYVIKKVECFVDAIPDDDITTGIVDSNGVSTIPADGTNVVTYSWKINKFDISSAIAGYTGGKAWFGGRYDDDGSGLVVSNQSTVNVDGTGPAYFYLQDKQDDVLPVLVYENANYTKNNFVLYIKYTTKINGANSESIAQITLDADFTIDNLTQAGSAHVANATVTATGIGNFTGTAQKFYTVLNTDFGGRMTDPNWGSENNPFVIENPLQMLRLSQIVNGGVAWNSIYSDSPSVVLAKNNNVFKDITERTYENAYFVVSADYNKASDLYSGVLEQSVDTVGGPKGFEPIGSNAYPFAAVSFAREGKENVTIKYSYQKEDMNYVGLFGYINGTHIYGIDVKGVGTVAGANYVGGIVGYANGGRIEDCSFAVSAASGQQEITGVDNVGGIVGYANATAIIDNDNDTKYATYMSAKVSGTNFVGGLVGYWKVTDGAQVNGTKNMLTYANAFSVVGSGDFAGGIAGVLDANLCTTDLTYLAFYTNGVYVGGTDNVMDVYGVNYVGALFGALFGNGYHNSATDSGPRTVLVINEPDDVRANVVANGAGYVMGGLVGYAQGVGILFGCDWENSTVTVSTGTVANKGVYVNTNGKNVSFVGGLVGVMGKNSTVESVRQEVSVSGGSVTVAGGQYTVTNRVAMQGNNFVGGIFGYISSNAGTYFGTTGTILGNSIKLVNNETVNGRAFVGGIAGGLGLVESYSSYVGSDTYDLLKNLLSETDNSDERILGYSTLEEDPYTANPFGRVINLANVEGSDRYVGGIFGYVGSRVNLVLENAPVSTTTNEEVLDNPSAYLNVFNGNAGKSGLQQVQIKGVSYVGGITGWLDNQAHTLTYVVNRAVVWGTSTTDSYAGGLVGYMNAGTIENCISVATEQVRVATDTYKGANYVGGLVGYIVGGKIVGSISTGFMFSSVGLNAGGVIGNGISPTIENTWTVYLGQNATYSTVSGNGRGKYVLVDSRIATTTGETVPSFVNVAGMVGFFTSSTSTGKIQIQTNIPPFSGNSKNKQLVFYNASGNDEVTGNSFERFENVNNVLHISLDMNTAESMIIGLDDVRFVNVPKDSGNSQTNKQNVENAYKKPSNSNLYAVEIPDTWPEYDGNGKYTFDDAYDSNGDITRILAILYFNSVVVGAYEDSEVKKPGYDKTFDPGSKDFPYIISTQEEWNEFAYSIYTGQKDYSGKFVKLNTDIVISNGTHKDTNGNALDFTAETTPNKSSSDSKNAKSNLGYNFAGNIAQGGDNNLSIVTVDGVRGKVTSAFKGTFEGNGHKITIQYNSGGYHRISAFPNANASFYDLTIDGYIYSGNNSSNSGYDIAAFVSKASGKIEFYNCTNNASIQGLRNAAGFTGYVSSHEVIIKGCVNNGNVTTYETPDNSDTYRPKYYNYGTGGIVACSDRSITIESCINNGKIVAPVNVGGIIGRVSGDHTDDDIRLESKLYLYNCANTGEVYSNFKLSDDQAQANLPPYRKYYGNSIWCNAGGLVGFVTKSASLHAFACYNSGYVHGIGNVVGGIVGTIGDHNGILYRTPNTRAKFASEIVYCYNTGVVEVGYDGVNQDNVINIWDDDGDKYCSSVVGGIAGVIANGSIKYCYNTGTIECWGGVGVKGAYHSRAGGIVGESTANSQADSSWTRYVGIINCYNVGKVNVHTNEKARYSSGILGYLDDKAISNSHVINSFTIKDAVYMNTNKRYYNVYAEGLNADPNKSNGGLPIALEDFTAVRKSDGTVAPIGSFADVHKASIATLTNDSAYFSGTAAGYIYLPGCLPQLAVFAVDTHNGLSMRSVNYGQNIYGDYEEQKAGDKYSPYIIKDGIDLLGLQSLVDLGYTFEGKFVEFANATNNIKNDGSNQAMVSSIINMPTYESTTQKLNNGGDAYKSSTPTGNFIQTGKSYHLFLLGAVCSDGRNTSANSAYTTWLSRNYAYDQSSARYTENATYSRSNFLPIGRNNGYNTVFRGNISGKQADDSNTEVANLRIVSSGSDYAFAGLFARAENANISNITVSGQVYSYATSENGTSMAGGIVANLSGKSVVDGCIAGTSSGTSSRSLDVIAYGKNNNYSSATVDNLTTYAGGIVGVGNTSLYKYTLIDKEYKYAYVYEAGTTGTVSNCKVVNATVQSAKNNIGGVVGFVASSSLDGSVTSDGKNNKFEIIGNRVLGADLFALEASDTGNADIGTRVGGIIGYSGKYTSVIISGCSVGTSSTTPSVTIKGENALGGIAGAMPDAINEIKDCSVNASTLIQRGNSWGNVENVSDSSVGDGGNHGTAIGGIVGHTYHNTSENAVTTTLSGNIVFNGNINIAQPTYKGTDSNANNSQDGVVRNVGGVFGDMASGASFATGARIQVNGTITVADKINEVRNIGGVAGRTRDVAFSGEFTVSANVSIPNAINVGGFIGRNRGVVNILADDTIITIGGTISGAHDVGGFIGNNSADDNSVLYIGANEYRRTRYERPLSIEISAGARILSAGDNVGGIVGNNFSQDGTGTGSIQIVKGRITNNGSVQGANAVGGIIGNNNANLVTGGGTGSAEVRKLTIVNAGAVKGANYVGGVIGLLNQGSVAGTFTNIGDVTGEYFVGGSIGYVFYAAQITALGNEDTKFDNGAIEGHTASGDALTAGDTAAQGVGTVRGKAYVGGSIGIMLGKIVGNANAKVVFTSSGIVDASDVAGYLGGSIGVIAGQVDYAQFISTGELKGINAITAVGGSVGFIGAPTPLLKVKDGNTNCTEEYAIDLDGALFNIVHIKNSHFESNGASLELTGTRVNEAKFDGNKQKEDYEWGGVGGAIGVIAGVANGFDGGDNWADNTYYAQGSVSAPGVYNVGGIVGFIRANNITINNMLAYDIDVTGGSNVGGIVGFTEGEKTVIANAFAISTSDSTGKYTAEYKKQDGTSVAGLAGGIIGKAADDTDASTSYWVKGYKNAELAGTNVNDLKNTLGRYTAITETIGQTTIIFTKELIGGTDVAEPVYPTPYEYLSAYYEEGKTHTVNGKSLTIADTFEYNEETQITTYKDWDWYFETYYKGASSNDTKVVKTTDGTWVYEKNTWAQYSTGTSQTGWYFVYANDAAGDGNVGTVNAKHTDKRSTQGEYTIVDRDFWKRIANAYTASEKEKELNDPSNANYKLNSDIVLNADEHGNKAPLVNNLYATATAATKSGYYLYIASSGDSRPTAINDGGKFYIQINTVDVGNAKESAKLAKNVAVYYRSIAMGSALTYNGYNRYAPISLQKDIKSEPDITDGKVDLDKKNSYAYTTQLVESQIESQKEAKTVGTYKSDVYVYYYDDTGKAYKVGGITQGAWKIKQRVLTMSTEGTTSAIYGSDNIATTVYIDNIVKEDINNIEFVLSVTGCSNVAIKWGVNNWSDNGVSIDYVGSDKSKDLSGSDANFNTDTIDKTTYKLKFTVKFTNAKNYSLSVVLADKQPGKNYTLNNAEKEVVVKKKELTITGPVGETSDGGKAEVTYDGNTHGATWTVNGIVTKYGDTLTSVLSVFNPQFVARIRKDPNKEEYLAPESFPLVQKGTAIINNRTIEFGYSDNANTILFSGAIDAGNYYLAFTNCDDNASNETNYYIKYEQKEDYTPNRPKSKSFTISTNMLTVTWNSTTASHVYEPDKKGVLTAKVVAKEPINNFKTFVEKYFETSWTNLKGTDISISAQSDNKTATITFTTGDNAGTYTANVKVKERTDQDVVNCGCNNATPTKSYKIDKKTITISFLDDGDKIVGSTEYVYNTDVQGLKTISISGLYSNQSVKYSLNVTSNDAKVPYSGKPYSSLSNSGSADLLGRDWIDAGTYTATLTLGTDSVSNNYQLTENDTSRVATAQWKINQKEIKINSVSMSNVTYDAQPHKPTFSLSIGTSSTGTYTWHNDTISINYKSGSVDAQAFVNAGKYNDVSVAQNAISAKRGSTDTTANYIVDSSSTNSISFEIFKREITLLWNDAVTSFVYNGNSRGLTISGATSSGYTHTVSNSTLDGATIKGCGNDTITVSLTGKQTEVNQTANGYKMSYKSHTVTGTNSGEQSVASNYTFGSQSSPDYFITPSMLTIKNVGGSTTKVYDATTSVTDTSTITFDVESSNKGDNGSKAYFTFVGIYDNKNVGAGKTVTLTFEFSAPNKNYEFDGVNVKEITTGEITRAELKVVLDKLRSGKATRAYNGNTAYGGTGVENGINSNRSNIYRVGEGFSVSGFKSSSDKVAIVASYFETGKDRSEFDPYVNNVYKDGNVYKKDNSNIFYKALKFSMSGDDANNYQFVVVDNENNKYSNTVGTNDNKGEVQSVIVYDSRDDANKNGIASGASEISIEITVKSIRVEYSNTAQSYATEDNKYFTAWAEIKGTNKDLEATGAEIEVKNGWMYENGVDGQKREYHGYKVIRGSQGSNLLGATVKTGTGMEFNYRLSNQPTLTIGYFVSSTDFAINSIAKLMIASFYVTASQNSTSPEILKIISSGYKWETVVTNEDYLKEPDKWDALFAQLEEKGYSVFLTTEEITDGNLTIPADVWGYYCATESGAYSKPPTSFKQTADISGIVTKEDMALIESFFTIIKDDGTEEHLKWGNGGTYITNFLKPSVGNVLTALGSVFVSTDTGFGGTYNGNGYVIEYLNIYGFDGATQNVGMFDKIGNKGSVSGLHLRNVTISANGGNVGGIAGEILQGAASSVVSNVSFHGSITVSGSGNVGGLFGKSERNIDKAIVLGTITANGGNVAGVVGVVDGLSCTLSNVVSLMQVDASGTVAPIANGGTVNNDSVFYLANAVWSKDGNGKIAYAGGNGTAKSYAELMGGSISGYGASKYYYVGDTPNQKDVYDVIDDVALTSIDVQNNSNPRQSMRLRDVVDVYLLMYSLSETTASGGEINGARTYAISNTSWLVGNKHGTGDEDAIVIANKQNVALLRQLRFATFVLTVDLTSYEVQSFGGAFYGTIYQNGHSNSTDWLKASFADVTKATIVNE